MWKVNGSFDEQDANRFICKKIEKNKEEQYGE